MFDRIIGVFKLDRQVFAEIERDTTATSQAAIIVAIVAALSVVGSVLGTLFTVVTGGELQIGGLIISIISTFLLTFVNWLIWSAVTYFVGTQLFNGQADLNEMLRVIGFAYSPRMLSIIPCIGGIIGAIWSLIASYFAIKEGLDLDDGQTIATVVIGWLITVVIGAILGALGIGGAIGAGALTSLFR